MKEQQKPDYILRGDNGRFYQSTSHKDPATGKYVDHEIVLAGPSECVSGDTVIEGDGRTIQWLAEHGIAPIVKTMAGPRQAGVPFLKGTDWLYEVTDDDGRSFSGTAKHLILTGCGYVPVSSLKAGDRLISYNSDPYRQRIGTVVSVRRTVQDNFYDLTVPYQHHYFAGGFIHHNTGKTIASLLKLHAVCVNYPKAQTVCARKTSASLPGTVLVTYRRLFARDLESGQIEDYGGKAPERFIYANGSTIWLGGLDNPDRILSSERDAIYINQLEELTDRDWMYLGTRVTGRGAVVPPEQVQLFADCNPSHSQHWIKKRAEAGLMTMLHSTHRDNPTLYDELGNLTDQGERTMAYLDNLTGALKLRLKNGVWANQEGAIYDEFDERIHVCEMPEKEVVSWYLCVDFGFTDPCVVLLVGEDSDRRWHIFRESYREKVLPQHHKDIILEWSREKTCDLCACDAARPGEIEELRMMGVNAVGAEKGPGSIDHGISLIKNRIHPVKGDTSSGFLDGRPRLTVSASCPNTIREFQAYRFKPETDRPEDADNHCFVAGTQILTKTGLKPIEKIEAGEYVWSPLGWNKVWQSSCTGLKNVVDYGAFTCTPDHKILTQRGLISIDALRYFDYVLVWQKTRRWSLMELITGVIQSPSDAATSFISEALAQKTQEASRHTCTVMYGNSIMGRFLTATKCITRTKTLDITRLAISSYSLIASTRNVIRGVFWKVQKSIWKRLSQWQQSPIERDLPRRKDMQNSLNRVENHGRTNPYLNSTALCVDDHTKHPSLLAVNSVISIEKCGRSGSDSIHRLNRTSHTDTATPDQTFAARTYNLNTDKGCYFANGILVSNSMDSIRYLAMLKEVGGSFTNSSSIVLPPRSGVRFVSGRNFVPRSL